MLQEMSVCLDIGYLCSGLWGKSVLDCTGIQEDTACTYIQVDFFLQQNGGEPTQGCQLPGIKRYHLDIKKTPKKHPFYFYFCLHLELHRFFSVITFGFITFFFKI